MYKKDLNILITGATGWVGKNFLNELQKIYPSEIFNEKVKAFGSKEQSISSTFYPENKKINIPIYQLSKIENFISMKKAYCMIHCAFITREKVKYLGLEKYINFNRDIINIVEKVVSNSNISKSIIISSGAVSVFELKKNYDKNVLKDPYGFLKLEEEKRLISCSDKYLVMRIYGLTGKFMRDPNIFAFGNFLLTALKGKAIKIKAKNNVIRSYCYGSDIAKASINWLFSEKIHNEIHEASTTIVSLYELAQNITKIYNLPEVISNIDTTKETDNYSCNIDKFSNFLRLQGFNPATLEFQIDSTFKYLQQNFIQP